MARARGALPQPGGAVHHALAACECGATTNAAVDLLLAVREALAGSLCAGTRETFQYALSVL